MSIAFVQQHTQGTYSGSVASINEAYTGNVTAGNLLFAFVSWFATTGTASCSDSLGNTWVPLPVQRGSAISQQGFYCVSNNTTGADTVTIAFTPNHQGVMSVSEYSGGINTLDQQTSNFATGTAVASGSVTTTQNGELVIGYGGGLTASDQWTVGSGFQLRTTTNGPLILEDQLNQNIGAFNATATLSLSDGWVMAVSTFYIGVAPPPVTSATTNTFIQNVAGLTFIGDIAKTYTPGSGNAPFDQTSAVPTGQVGALKQTPVLNPTTVPPVQNVNITLKNIPNVSPITIKNPA